MDFSLLALAKCLEVVVEYRRPLGTVPIEGMTSPWLYDHYEFPEH